MKRIGITGGIGSGKSIVCKTLETMGFPVFYSDEQAKALMHHDADVRSKIISLLGGAAYTNGTLNRTFIAQQIFNDPQKREQLNHIVHPAVRKAFEDFAATYRTVPLVFFESALLIETGTYKRFDAIVVVLSDEETRIARVVKRDKTTFEEVKSRLTSQWTDEQRIPFADFCIDNNGKIALLPQLLNMLQKIAPNEKEAFPTPERF